MEMQFMESGRAAVGSKVKLALGIFFTLAGLLLTLDNLDLFDAGRVLRYWPVLLVVVGALMFREAGSRGLAVVLMVAGTLLVIHNAHWLRFSFAVLWPLLLIGIGLVIVLRAFGIVVPTALVLSGKLANGGNDWAVLDTRKAVLPANELSGRRLLAFMGGHQLVLTEPVTYDGPVVVEALAVWGGIDIRVPPGWEVIADVIPVMGGIEVKTTAARGGRQLIVRGAVVMAGMEIKNAEARAQ
jgi:hypothetical protein